MTKSTKGDRRGQMHSPEVLSALGRTVGSAVNSSTARESYDQPRRTPMDYSGQGLGLPRIRVLYVDVADRALRSKIGPSAQVA